MTCRPLVSQKRDLNSVSVSLTPLCITLTVSDYERCDVVITWQPCGKFSCIRKSWVAKSSLAPQDSIHVPLGKFLLFWLLHLQCSNTDQLQWECLRQDSLLDCVPTKQYLSKGMTLPCKLDCLIIQWWTDHWYNMGRNGYSDVIIEILQAQVHNVNSP